MDLVDDRMRARVEALYRAPERHYHGLAHVEALLGLAARHREEFFDPEIVDAAIWFHDAIYDAARSDNERKSAELAVRSLDGRADQKRLERLRRMIEATATHALPAFDDAAARHDAALFLDMDLSILGADQAGFDAYEEAVRREYAFVDDAAWRLGRKKVLETFLARPRIFHTETFGRLFEVIARRNLARSIAKLG